MTHDEEYAMGFAEGETQRFYDKQKGINRANPKAWQINSMRARGFWDGYRPRSAAWAVGAKPMLYESIEA